jgi:alpha-amylase
MSIADQNHRYYWITQAFQSTSGSISNLMNGVNQMKSACLDTTLLGSFMENHDNPRFPSYTSDMSLATNAIAFTMLADGIPVIYEGQEQHYSGGAAPLDREAIWLSSYSANSTLYRFISLVNQIRTQALKQDNTYLTYKAYPSYSDGSTIVMRKGSSGYQIVGVFSNLGSAGNSYTLALSSATTGFTASQQVIEVLSCTSYTADSNGSLSVAMAGGLPRVFYPQAQLSNGGICSALIGKQVLFLLSPKSLLASSGSATLTSTTSLAGSLSSTSTTTSTSSTLKP